MHEPNLFLVFIEPLNKSKIAYMTTGSVASIIYGQPRVTHDIDLVLGLHINNISQFVEVFPAGEFYCPPLDVIKTEISQKTGGHFNLIHHETGFKADIYPVCQDELHTWAMANRKKIKIEECEVWLAPPEYVIIRKFQYFKEGGSSKHLSDIKNMLEISGGDINTEELKLKIKKYRLTDEWEKLCKAGS